MSLLDGPDAGLASVDWRSVAWATAGAAGAGLAFARHAWPAVGPRLRNLTLAAVVGLAGVALSFVVTGAWRFGAGWMTAALLLQWSHMLVAPGRLVWTRPMLATVLVAAAAAVIAP